MSWTRNGPSYTCVSCNLPTDADDAPSPGEADHICADCYDLALGLLEWGNE